MRILALLLVCSAAVGADDHDDAPQDAAEVIAVGDIDAEHPDSEPTTKDHLGLLFVSTDRRFSINPWLRGQFRFSDPFDSDPLTASEYDNPPGSELEVRRARLKVEGHLFSPRIGFYYEHELSGDHPLLDMRLDLEIHEDLLLRIGQYKVLYNRERVDSSGKQQFVERSIATYAFTLDRQVGVTASRRFKTATTLENWLMLGINKGTGRGGIDEDGGDPMYLGRWQWNFLGTALPFSQSDLKFRQAPAASLAFGAAHVRGPYTRYSSSGGGQLDGFDSGGDERYTLQQYLQEFAWHYDGMSIQQEYHVKEITDHETGAESTLRGGYAQFGKLWEAGWHDRSFGVEGALRVARVDWDIPGPDRVQGELTLVANLFIRGHDNKISAEVSQVSLDDQSTGKDSDLRFRLQWDVSF